MLAALPRHGVHSVPLPLNPPLLYHAQLRSHSVSSGPQIVTESFES